ncbi:hypothetical protein AVEN_176046-1 [Araneus ventricosus]|uniref:Retrotransposon gag domain-containing protein n=1 Tax=Araneus ventricosus TaxID=182803 RepID=A0A4Y2E9S8_ARAVE|nr:hypothetical protein AVEN_176046-1 [Araneus ventricosus]
MWNHGNYGSRGFNFIWMRHRLMLRLKAISLHVIGEECLEIYNTFNEVSSASMNDLLAKFQAYFVPQRNITYERQKLLLLVQRERQFVDDFITELRKQLRNCDYGSLSDSILVDQLVRGLRESRLREHLLRVPDMDIKKAVGHLLCC